MIAPAHALVALAERARLQLRRERTGGHHALAVRKVKDAPREHLDLALPVARLRVLVRPALRMMRVRRAAQGRRRGRCPGLGEGADVRDEKVRVADVADQLGICGGTSAH